MNNVNVILKDSYGFLWFGTDDGLNRFDGENIKTFQHDPTDSTSIPENEILSLFEDSQGRLWVGTAHGGGLSRYDRKTTKFHTIKDQFDEVSTYIAFSTPLSIVESKDSTLWIGTHNGLKILKKNKEKFEYINSTQIDQPHVLELLNEGDSIFWLGTESGLFQYSVRNDSMIYYAGEGQTLDLTSNQIRSLHIDSDEYLWVGTMKGLNRIDRKERTVVQYLKEDGLTSNIVLHISEESDRLWLGTDGGGITIYNKSLNRFDRLKSANRDLDFISAQHLAKTGSNMVIGTVHNGVKMLKLSSPNFVHHKYFHPNISKYGKNTILDIVEDKQGDIWIGTDGAGLYRQRKSDSFEGFDESNKSSISLSSNVVKSLCFDKKGNLFIGTYAGGLNVHDFRSGKTINFKNDSDSRRSISDDNVWAIFQDSKSRIWIGTLFGLNLYHPDSKSFTRYPSDFQDSTTVSSNVIFSIHEEYGQVWFATSDGLSLYVEETDNFRQFLVSETDPGDNFIKEIVDHSGLGFFVVTKAGVFDFDGTDFIEMSTLNSHLSATPESLLFDDDGRFWVGTTKGLMRIDTVNGSSRLFQVGDGIQSKEFQMGAALKTTDGEFYMGGLDGFNVFRPQEIISSIEDPIIALTNLYLFHKQVNPKIDDKLIGGDLNFRDEIILDYQQNVVSIEYAALDYDYPRQNEYSHRLVGFEDKWNLVDGETRATYTNLAPGQYQFMVRAKNKEGSWSPHVKMLNINIPPPFWQDPLFRVTSIFGIALVLYAFYAFRMSSLVKQKKELEHAVSVRTLELTKEVEDRKAAQTKLSEAVDLLKNTQSQLVRSEKMASIGTLTAGIAHEINNPLNYILGGVNVLENLLKSKITDGTQVEEDIQEARNIIQKGVRRSTEIIKSLMIYTHQGKRGESKPELVNLSEVVNTAVSFVNHKLIQGIKLSISVPKSSQVRVIPDKFSQIILNILTNAIDATMEFDGPKEITIKSGSEGFPLVISNTGKQIDSETGLKLFDPFYTTKDPGSGTGLGLWVTYLLIEEHQGTLKFENSENGVSFIVDIPNT